MNTGNGARAQIGPEWPIPEQRAGMPVPWSFYISERAGIGLARNSPVELRISFVSQGTASAVPQNREESGFRGCGKTAPQRSFELGGDSCVVARFVPGPSSCRSSLVSPLV
ncbi:MAG: hypothetical protein ACLQPN_23595, partial [Bryobacteraceae bacterium]